MNFQKKFCVHFLANIFKKSCKQYSKIINSSYYNIWMLSREAVFIVLDHSFQIEAVQLFLWFDLPKRFVTQLKLLS